MGSRFNGCGPSGVGVVVTTRDRPASHHTSCPAIGRPCCIKCGTSGVQSEGVVGRGGHSSASSSNLTTFQLPAVGPLVRISRVSLRTSEGGFRARPRNEQDNDKAARVDALSCGCQSAGPGDLWYCSSDVDRLRSLDTVVLLRGCRARGLKGLFLQLPPHDVFQEVLAPRPRCRSYPIHRD